MSGRRRRARELALQLLYQRDIAGTEPEEMFARTDEYVNATPEVQEYASRLVLGTIARLSELDELLGKQSEHWRLGRMPVVDRNLLRVALYELLHEDETPDPVVIDEAVEIAKKFSTPSSAPFINGVLDGIRRTPVRSARGRRGAAAEAGPGGKPMIPVLALALVLLSVPGVRRHSVRVRSRRPATASNGPEPWKTVRPVEEAGYRVVLSSPDGRSLVATVEVDGSPFVDTAPYPVDPRTLPADVRDLLAEPLPAERRAGGALADAPAGDHDRARGGGAGRRVGLEADPLRAPGPPPRERPFLPAEPAGLVRRAFAPRRRPPPARRRPGPTGDRDPHGARSERADRDLPRSSSTTGISGVRHRWIEVFVPGLGWVPSDPGGLANTVTARHLALPGLRPTASA